MTPEGKVTQHLIRRVKELGGTTRKVSWEGRVGAPDRLVFLRGLTAWFELKAVGGKPTQAQLREHELLRKHGQTVYLCYGTNDVDMAVHNIVARS